MVKTEQDHRREIVAVGRLVYRRGWVAANDGNISVRLGPGRILCTPTGVSKGSMQPEDLIICDDCGNKVEGRKERTSEIAMHMTIYQMRPDIHSVVHTHAPFSTGFAVAGRPLTSAILPEIVVGLGCVPLADYGLPGTPALSEALRPHIPKYDAVLMQNHGVVCYGSDLQNARFKMEMVEHFARIALVAHILGGPQLLPREAVGALFEARRRYGVHSLSEPEPGFPLVAEDSRQSERKGASRAELREMVEELMEEILRDRVGMRR